jgi:predicted metal-dependent peptidase
MQFARIIGKIDPILIEKVEERLSQLFLELGLAYDNFQYGATRLGGDPLLFSLLYPIQHIATLNIPTAATDGLRVFWNPKFVLKLSRRGLRFLGCHEAFHALYMHPQRRGSRHPKLWNIAVDYIVNGIIMEDLVIRKQNPTKNFTEHLGRFITLDQYVALIKDPFHPPAGFEDLRAEESNDAIQLPKPDEDRDLTPEEIQELEKRASIGKCFYADPNLKDEMKSPEKIYDLLYGLLPKCPKCGQLGIYPNPKGKAKSNGGCDHDGGLDIFGLGGTLDEHIDAEEDEEKLAKRISDAIETTKRMAGKIPGSLEGELGKLIAPKITWKDVIRGKLLVSRDGGSRSDWSRFRTRPMFSGMLVPKRKEYQCKVGCLLDTSASMSQDDMTFAVSQLQSLDQRAEIWLTCCDTTVYWDQTIQLKRANATELSKIKPVGRGGTTLSDYINEYHKHLGDCDFLIVLTDGGLWDGDIAAMRDPGIPVFWVLVNSHGFKAPFGKTYELRG